MRLIKEFWCDSDTPSDEEIKEGLEVAENENCIVRLNYKRSYGGCYCLDIIKGMTFENCKNRLPKYWLDDE